MPLPERWCPSRFFLRNAGAPLTFPLLRLSLFPRSSAQVRFYLVLLFSNSKLNNHLLGLSLSRSERSSEQPTRTAAHSKVNYRPAGSLEPNSFFKWIGFAEYLLPPTIRTSIDPLKGPPGSVPREHKLQNPLSFTTKVGCGVPPPG